MAGCGSRWSPARSLLSVCVSMPWWESGDAPSVSCLCLMGFLPFPSCGVRFPQALVVPMMGHRRAAHTNTLAEAERALPQRESQRDAKRKPLSEPTHARTNAP